MVRLASVKRRVQVNNGLDRLTCFNLWPGELVVTMPCRP
jgi:hypothetical protein